MDPVKPTEKIVRVGVSLFLYKEGSILMGKRRGPHGAGKWGVVGGHVEYGESLEDAILRELFEETGLTHVKYLKRGPFINAIFASEGKHFIDIAFTGAYCCGEPTVKESNKLEGNWTWQNPHHLPAPLFDPISQFMRERDGKLPGE